MAQAKQVEANGRDDDISRYEEELTGLLRDRIKPGLNRGSIPLVARSIAKEMARLEYDGDPPEDEEELEPDEDDDDGTELDLESALHEIQAELGKDWVLYFSVQNGDSWFTAEKEDASQRIMAPSVSVLTKAVAVLNDGGGRSSR